MCVFVDDSRLAPKGANPCPQPEPRRIHDPRGSTDVCEYLNHHTHYIRYGDYFLLTSLMNKSSGYMDNPLRQNFFRAGHAHAGVIVILSLVCQLLAGRAMLPDHLYGWRD